MAKLVRSTCRRYRLVGSPLAVAALLLTVPGRSDATIVLAATARDGVVVCADKLRIHRGGPRTTTSLVTKIFKTRDGLISGFAGKVSLVKASTKATVYDAEVLVQEFFASHPENLSPVLFREFDSFLLARIKEAMEAHYPGAQPAEHEFEVVFYWLDDVGYFRCHSARIRNSTLTPLDFEQTKAFSNTSTVDVVATGVGHEVLRALVGNDSRLEKYRASRVLMDLIQGKMRVSAVSVQRATVLLKRLVGLLSRAEPAIRSGPTMSEESDCLTLARHRPSPAGAATPLVGRR